MTTSPAVIAINSRRLMVAPMLSPRGLADVITKCAVHNQAARVADGSFSTERADRAYQSMSDSLRTRPKRRIAAK